MNIYRRLLNLAIKVGGLHTDGDYVRADPQEEAAELDQEFYQYVLFNELSDPNDRRDIVCLCGSGRFKEEFDKMNEKLTLEGNIVLSIGVTKKALEARFHEPETFMDVCERLDKLHLAKIKHADSVFVINVNGYIGESTRKEIEYAESIGKPIEYLEPL